ncbi:hypothetical protein ACR9H3_05250 [Enterobacter ludwigii]|uniref:hypothetical protein n=1 Tax=Enterobacter ludwigii TaxID=299767 RepID=UPI0008FFC4BE|nr:hypothetical protein [Enterobacter ludwigii]
MLSSIKLIVKLILCFFVSLSIILLSIKTLTYKKSTSSEKIWNEVNSCYAITYIPDYKPFGGVGRVLRLFSNQSFSLSMTKLEKMKSSAWHFWEYQFSDLVAPEWSGIDFLSPSDSGFSGWILPECKK